MPDIQNLQTIKNKGDTELNPDNQQIPVFNDLLPISCRIAVYDNLKSIPRVIDFNYNSIEDFLAEIPQKTYSFSHELGGKIPYTILKEIIENLIHANFQDIAISIMDNGNSIIISDQGPGIIDKEIAFLPGYTSATQKMKKFIRGVGSGLPIVKETIVFSGGSIDIKDNIKQGTVVSLKIENNSENKLKKTDTGSGKNTDPENRYKEPVILEDSISIKSPVFKQPETAKNTSYQVYPEITKDITSTTADPSNISGSDGELLSLKLSMRQKKILSLILELEETGPARIARELGFSLSTSYRELVFLESVNLLELTESGKRKLTVIGKKYLEYYSNSF